MPTQRARFRDFLTRGFASPRGVIDAVMEALEPFFRQSDEGVFALASVEDVSSIKILAAVNSLTRGTAHPPCSAIEYVSAASPSCKDIKDCVCPRLEHCIVETFGEELMHDLGPERRADLGDQLWNCLCEPLWHAFETGKWVEINWPLRLEIRAVLLAVLTHFVGFKVAGDDEMAETLRPMVEQLSIVSVLGLKRNMPDTVVTLVR